MYVLHANQLSTSRSRILIWSVFGLFSFIAGGHVDVLACGDQSSSNDQPCDLRLLVPDTMLKELTNNTTADDNSCNGEDGTNNGHTENEPAATTTTNNGQPNISIVALNKIEKFKMSTLRGSGSAGSGPSFNVNQSAIVGGAYKCKQCTNSYARLHSLNRHLRFECGVEPQFECPVCKKKSKHKHNLVLHMRTHQQR